MESRSTQTQEEDDMPLISPAADLEYRQTCPPWCQNDHSIEPADHHAGRLDVLRDLDVFLFNLPRAPVR